MKKFMLKRIKQIFVFVILVTLLMTNTGVMTIAETVSQNSMLEAVEEKSTDNDVVSTDDAVENEECDDISIEAVSTIDRTVLVDYVKAQVGKKTGYADMCLQYAIALYKNAGASNAKVGVQSCCANFAGNVLIQSTSREVPLGALVFWGGPSSQKTCSSCGKKPGHVGVYVGNGVVSCEGSGLVTNKTISQWENSGYSYRGWGYPANVEITDSSGSITLWGINDYDTFSGNVQLWGKRFDNDSNHYAVFYVDDQPKTGHLGADSSGYFSFWLNSKELTNGFHRLRIEYVNSISSVTDEKIINISNLVTLWGINDYDTFSGNVQLWGKRFDNDSNHYAVFYIDDQPKTGHLGADASGYFSFWLDTKELSNGTHRLRIEYVNSTSLVTDEKEINIYNENTNPEKDSPTSSNSDSNSSSSSNSDNNENTSSSSSSDLNNKNNNSQPSELDNSKNDSNKDFITIPIDNSTSEFVKRMYTVALSRDAETKGLNDWSGQLSNQEIDGAGIANGFINSVEFKNRNLNNNDYLDVLYRTIFDREADAGGKAYWMDKLQKGISRTEVLSGFVNSQEFSNLCDRFGIARGTMQADGSSIYRPGVRGYVLRMYTKALNRDGETVGVEDWTNRINTKVMRPEAVAKSFFSSQEFINRNLNNADYVETLYQTFMDRASDEGGKQYWINQLNSGMSRQQVLEGFSRSEEFSKIMKRYGL